MRLSHRDDRWKSERAPSERLESILRLAREQAEPRARLEGDRQLRFLAVQIAGAAQVAAIIGGAVENFGRAMRAPLRQGRAGGIVRARAAWRHFDGTFMPEKNTKRGERRTSDMPLAAGHALAAPTGIPTEPLPQRHRRGCHELRSY